jgi:hypothetical protein
VSEDLTAVARFLYETGTLKNTARTGWWMAGVQHPEPVAEHSWRTALIATIIAKLEGADQARAAFLAVWHDSQETRTGDVNYLDTKYTGGEADPTTSPPIRWPACPSFWARLCATWSPNMRPRSPPGGDLRAGRRQAGVHDPGHRVLGPGLGQRPTVDRQQPGEDCHQDGAAAG